MVNFLEEYQYKNPYENQYVNQLMMKTEKEHGPLSIGRDWMLNDILYVDRYVENKIDAKEDLKDNII